MSTKTKHNEPFQPFPVRCEYCGKQFTPGLHKYRQKWHGCQKSEEARVNIQREKQRYYDKNVRPMLKNKPKRSRKSGSSERHFILLAEGSRLYPCKSKVSSECWGESPNRFNCPPCLEKLENSEEIGLDVLGFSTIDPPNILL